MHGDEDGGLPGTGAPSELRLDTIMVRVEDLTRPRLRFARADGAVPRNHGVLAVRGDRALRPEWPITVDHQAGISLRDHERAELPSELLRNALDADVARDMRGELRGRQAQRAERAREQAPSVVGGPWPE